MHYERERKKENKKERRSEIVWVERAEVYLFKGGIWQIPSFTGVALMTKEWNVITEATNENSCTLGAAFVLISLSNEKRKENHDLSLLPAQFLPYRFWSGLLR